MSDRPKYTELVRALREVVLFRDEAPYLADTIIEAVVERLQADHAVGFGAIRIADAQMSVRAENALHVLGFTTLGDLTTKTAGDFLRARVGRRVLSEIESTLRVYGLALKAEP